MKKIIVLLMVLISLCGCQNKPGESDLNFPELYEPNTEIVTISNEQREKIQNYFEENPEALQNIREKMQETIASHQAKPNTAKFNI